jgi:hypothetical protein
MGDKERFAEDLLDAALKCYHSEEPRPGLEGRILATVRAREQTVRRGIWTWAWAVGAVAGLALVAVVVSLPRRQHVPAPALTPRPTPLTATKPVAPPASLVGERFALPRVVPRLRDRPYRAAGATLAAHRPMQFPTPRPLTRQEQFLLLYVRTVSRSATVIGADPPRRDEELGIPELSVAALDPIRPLSEPEGRTEY